MIRKHRRKPIQRKRGWVTKKVWKEKYAKYLRTAKWKRKREKILERDNHTCQNKTCGSHKTLVCHHRHYRNVFNERDEDLVILCRRCHDKIHKRRKSKQKRKKYSRV